MIPSVSELRDTVPMALTASAAGTDAPEIPAAPELSERVGRLARLLAIDERLLVVLAVDEGLEVHLLLLRHGPLPDAPSSTTNSPRRTSSDTSRKAATSTSPVR